MTKATDQRVSARLRYVISARGWLTRARMRIRQRYGNSRPRSHNRQDGLWRRRLAAPHGVDRPLVDRREWLEIGNPDVFIDLVDRVIERSKLDNLARQPGQESAVRRSSARRAPADAGNRLDGRTERTDQRASRRQKRISDERPLEVIVQTMSVEDVAHAPWRASDEDCGENRKLNETSSVPGMMLPAPVPAWMFEI